MKKLQNEEVRATSYLWINKIKENEFIFKNNRYKKACNNCHTPIHKGFSDGQICTRCLNRDTVIIAVKG